MQLSRTEINELCNQFSALHDDVLSEVERQALEKQIAENQATRRLYVRYCRVCAGLCWDLRDAILKGSDFERELLSTTGEAEGACDQVTLPKSRFQRAVRYVNRPVPLSLLTAAGVLVLLLIPLAYLVVPLYQDGSGPGFAGGTNDLPFVAQITRLSEVEWMAGQVGVGQGAHLQLGRHLELRRGVVEITFRSGARVSLRGPAAITLTSANSSFLEHGNFQAFVPPQAHGYSLMTSRVTLVDLGTRFRVNADREKVDVRVLSGAVSAEVPGGAPFCLNSGDAFRFAREQPDPIPIPQGDESLAEIELPQVQFYRDRQEWLAALKSGNAVNHRSLDFTAANLAMATGVGSPPARNKNLGKSLSFAASETGLLCDVTITALEREATLVYGDKEPPKNDWPEFDNALSIGDIDNYENDDFSVAFSGPVLPTALAIELVHNDQVAGESLTIVGQDKKPIGRLSNIPPPSMRGRTFIGVICNAPISAAIFNEDAGGDDIAVAGIEVAGQANQREEQTGE